MLEILPENSYSWNSLNSNFYQSLTRSQALLKVGYPPQMGDHPDFGFSRKQYDILSYY